MVGGVRRPSTGRRNARARTRVSGLRFGMSYECGTRIKEAQYLYLLSKRPTLRSMLTNYDYKGSLQKTQWRKAVLRAEKFVDLITANPKVLNEESGSRNNHRCCGTRSCHSVDSVLSVWNKTSQKTEKSWKKFIGPWQKPGDIFTDNFLVFGILFKNYLGITERLRLIDPRRTELPPQKAEE